MSAAPSPDHLLHWPSPDAPRGRLHLMPEHAAFEPDTRTLFVADVHLGKAAVFRARGLPVPQGTTTATLTRLSQAIDRSGARHLVVLGDFLHARESHASSTLDALAAWRQRHPHLHCLVIEGNHDVHAGPLPAAFDIEVRTEPYAQAWLRGVHHAPTSSPDDTADACLTLAGHVHPVVHLRGRTDRLRLPAFWLHGNVLTLPAFGEFTGGFTVTEGQCFALTGRDVIPLMPRR